MLDLHSCQICYPLEIKLLLLLLYNIWKIYMDKVKATADIMTAWYCIILSRKVKNFKCSGTGQDFGLFPNCFKQTIFSEAIDGTVFQKYLTH